MCFAIVIKTIFFLSNNFKFQLQNLITHTNKQNHWRHYFNCSARNISTVKYQSFHVMAADLISFTLDFYFYYLCVIRMVNAHDSIKFDF